MISDQIPSRLLPIDHKGMTFSPFHLVTPLHSAAGGIDGTGALHGTHSVNDEQELGGDPIQ